MTQTRNHPAVPAASTPSCYCAGAESSGNRWNDPHQPGWGCPFAASRGHTPHPTTGADAAEYASDWLLNLVGWHDHGACLVTPTPTAATLLALQHARGTAGQRWTVCATSGTLDHHRSVLHTLGVPESAIATIDHFEDHSLRPDALAAHLATHPGPTCVIATAGDPTTGAMDPLIEISDLCQRYGAWLHVDGGYGGPAVALLNECVDMRPGLTAAQSVTLTPHLWLYAPTSAGVALLRDPPPHLTPRSHDAAACWPLFDHLGETGYRRLIARDIVVAQSFSDALGQCPGVQLVAHGLSVVCFRPTGLTRVGLLHLARAAQACSPLRVQVVELPDGPALRLICANPEATTKHVQALLNVVAR